MKFYLIIYQKIVLKPFLFGKNNQQCRITVRSYHLLNYSHSLRIRSITNYQQQRTIPGENVWEKRLLEQSSSPRQTQGQQQPTRILKRTSNDTNSSTVTTPKSAPPTTSTHEKPNFVEVTTTSIKEQQMITKSTHLTSTEKSTLPQVTTTNSLLLSPCQKNSLLPPSPVEKLPEPELNIPSIYTTLPIASESTAPLTAFPTNPRPDSLLLRAIQESKQMQNLVEHQPNTQSIIVQQQWDAIPPPSLPISCKTIPTSSLATQQQPVDLLMLHQQTWETSTRQPAPNTFFAQAIENMSRAPPSSLLSSQSEQQSSIYSSPSQSQSFQQQQQQASLSILQRAIQQSEQQFNTNQTSAISNEFMHVAPFQPFDLLYPNTYPGFPIAPLLNQVPYQYQQQQSPVQSNNIRMVSSHTISSPYMSHNSPPSQPQTAQQMSSPRTTGGSTLQFVPSQVVILVFGNRSNEFFEYCKAIKDIIEVKTTDKNKKEICIQILPIFVLCNEIASDERRSNFTQTNVEQWTAKDKCFD
ncbi:unnamed protein product [Rotaria sp. Silwood2]|nr:unnamed protein product [Rotaria sp. Silwood2]